MKNIESSKFPIFLLCVLLLVNQLNGAPSLSFQDQIKNKISSPTSLLNINQLEIPKAEPTDLKEQCDLDCQINEICLKDAIIGFRCVCPRELNFVTINGQCREYLPKMSTCDILSYPCQIPGEECILGEKPPKGRCQCKFGYRRDEITLECKQQFGQIDEKQKYDKGLVYQSDKPEKILNRRRPTISDTPLNDISISEDYDYDPFKNGYRVENIEEENAGREYSDDENQAFYDKILSFLPQSNEPDYLKAFKHKKVSLKSTAVDNNRNMIEESIPNESTSMGSPITKNTPMFSNTTLKSTTTRTTTTTSTTTTTTNKTTTTTTTSSTTTTKKTIMTDAPTIYTKNLEANAGSDIHVYYPSRTCILNGSLSKYVGKNKKQGIVKWSWTKLDSSPAFGKFLMSSNQSIVIYENLMEGVYRFMLKIYSLNGEMSQDTVDVYVHSSYITDSYDDKSQIKSSQTFHHSLTELQVVYDNLIQIELDYKPEKFSQAIENNFVKHLEVLLKQSKLNFNNPKVIHTNTRISTGSKKSRVILEFFVCEDLPLVFNEDVNIFDFGKFSELEEDSMHSAISNKNLSALKQNVITSSKIVKLLKRKSLGDLIDSTLEYINRLPINHENLILYPPSKYSELKIIDVSQLTCEVGNFTIIKKCSQHGVCDHFTGKCVCNKYWMPNLYLYYLKNEDDLTSGNNCEWNAVLVAILTLMTCFMTIMILKCVFRYFFYYLFCCCLCNGKNAKKLNKNIKRSLRGKDRYRYFENESEEKLRSDIDDEDFDDYSEQLSENDISIDKSRNKKSTFKNFISSFKKVPLNNHKYALLENQEDLELSKSTPKRKNLIKNRISQRLGAELDQFNGEEDVVYDKYTSPTHSQIKEYKNLI